MARREMGESETRANLAHNIHGPLCFSERGNGCGLYLWWKLKFDERIDLDDEVSFLHVAVNGALEARCCGFL